MNDLAFLQDWLAKPEPGAIEVKRESSNFLDKPLSDTPVSINVPEGTVPEPEKAQTVNKSVGKTAKEAILPQVRKAADTKERVSSVLSAAVPDISEAPVPTGGIGLLVFLALLVVFAISPSDPSNSKSPSRLSLLWGSILGNYTYKRSSSAPSTSSSAPASKSSGSSSSSGSSKSSGGSSSSSSSGGGFMNDPYLQGAPS